MHCIEHILTDCCYRIPQDASLARCQQDLLPQPHAAHGVSPLPSLPSYLSLVVAHLALPRGLIEACNEDGHTPVQLSRPISLVCLLELYVRVIYLLVNRQLWKLVNLKLGYQGR